MTQLLLILLIVALALCYLYARGGIKVGAGQSKSEAFAISELSRLTGAKFPTVNPSWLNWRNPFTKKSSRLELDGYNEKLGIALEFSGPLHTKWFPETESYRDYLTRVLKDQAKKEICEKRGVCLIVLDMSLPKRHYRDYFASRLYDCGKGPRADNYIVEQVAEPYRNEQMDAQLLS
jgi:hypothetical protein